MLCEHAKMLINEYMDGSLDEDKKSGLAAHVKTCPECAKEYADAVRLKEALSGLPDAMPPEGLLKGALEKARKNDPAIRRPAMVRRIAALAAALLVTIGVTWYVYSANNFQNAPMADQAQSGTGGNEKMSAMEAPARANAPAASSAPAESSAAAAASAPASAEGSPSAMNDDVQRNLGSKGDYVAAAKPATLQYEVSKKYGTAFHKELLKILDTYGVAVLEDSGSISFELPESAKSEFSALLKKYGLSTGGLQEIKEFPVPVNIVILKS